MPRDGGEPLLPRRAVIGQVDEAADATLRQTFPDLRCDPLRPLFHS